MALHRPRSRPPETDPEERARPSPPRGRLRCAGAAASIGAPAKGRRRPAGSDPEPVNQALAIATSVAATLLAVAAVALLSRCLRLVRQLSFPLYITALTGGLKVYLLLIGEAPSNLSQALSWIL